MRLAWLVVIAGCWTGGEATRPPAPDPDDPVRPRAAYPAHSEWSGVYRCSQGITGVTLTLDAKPNGALKGIFDFGPTEENPAIPSGAYRLAGTIKPGREGTFVIALDPVEWIDAPDGYIMVAVSATSSRKWRRLVGRIDHPSCGELDVRRTD